MLPIIIQYSAMLVSPHHPKYALFAHLIRAVKTAGVNSTLLSSILVGLASQLWLRRYHPGWYRKYNYILGGALDGGAQIMIFILSFAVFGASGVSRPFPSVSRCVPFPVPNKRLLADNCIFPVGGKSQEGKHRLL